MKRRLLTILIIASGLLVFADVASAQEGTALPLVSVEGNRFVDESGQTVVFRGVSLSDPDRLERLGRWNQETFEAAAGWGMNIVRLPVHPAAWRERGQDAYLQLLDQGIEWAADLGMYVIIDWHTIGNLRTELFQHPMYNTTRTETFRFWKTIAARYRDNPVVAFYELFNEPTRYNGTLGRISWAQHKELMEEIIEIIYAHDRSVIPLVAGFNWAFDLTEAGEDPIELPGVAYVTHPYPQKRSRPWEEKWEADFGFMADTYPVMATELGFMAEEDRGAHIPVIGDETYGEAIIGYFEKKGISWVAWVFDPDWSPQLITGWDFEPTRQGRFFRGKFRALNPGG
jgi:hypothetical protein